MKKGLKTHAQLKKELDKIFSQYIRWAYADDSGMVECYTCHTKKHVKEIQAGHFQSRKHMATRWHENNVRPQCVKCNMFSQGEQYLFGLKLEAEIGSTMFEELMKLSKGTEKYSRSDLEYLIDYYKKKVQNLVD